MISKPCYFVAAFFNWKWIKNEKRWLKSILHPGVGVHFPKQKSEHVILLFKSLQGASINHLVNPHYQSVPTPLSEDLPGSPIGALQHSCQQESPSSFLENSLLFFPSLQIYFLLCLWCFLILTSFITKYFQCSLVNSERPFRSRFRVPKWTFWNQTASCPIYCVLEQVT